MSAMAQPLPPRHLVLKSLARATGVASLAAHHEIDDRIDQVWPGQMQILSYYLPGLRADDEGYTISATQKVDFVDKDKGLQTREFPATQEFRVVAPQFSIPAENFHSTYPPQGQADQPSIAPHIVFNDADLPWERDVTDGPGTGNGKDTVPWLAVFPFDCNKSKAKAEDPEPELRLTKDQLVDAGMALNGKETQTSSTFSISTTLGSYLDLTEKTKDMPTKMVTPAFPKTLKENMTDAQKESPVEVIFLNDALYKKLFYRVEIQDGKLNYTEPDIESFKYCAHVRNVNTDGMTGAGLSDKGLFSVVHSKRSGPRDVSADSPPRSQAVHLVSLEHLQQLRPAPGTLVALVSLYRWSYLCQPPLSVNFIDAMRDLGIALKYSQFGEDGLDKGEKVDLNAHFRDTPENSYFRCGKKVTEILDKSIEESPSHSAKGKMLAAMKHRLENGFSLVRYRVQSGEETVGLFRGPLLPVMPIEPPRVWPFNSNSGQDYQVLDKTLRMMDITYSSAWQLGRTMAASDLGFVSALMRIRTRAIQNGLRASGLAAAAGNLGVKTKAGIMSSLESTARMMNAVSDLETGTPAISLRSRWNRSRKTELPPDNDDAVAVGVEDSIGLEGSAAGTGGTGVVHDLFGTASEDWRMMHDWILDHAMYLSGVPTQYLIPDPKLLPKESLRFFYVDGNWTDCFIDGALSCANHSSLNDQDLIRETIKSRFNDYLKTDIARNIHDSSAGTVGKPQVPVFGFFIRSSVVSAFKDLIIEVPFPKGTGQDRAPVLSQRRLGPDILMVLLDRLPDTGEIEAIKFTQPPHQQRFAVADFLGTDSATYLFRKLFYKDTKVKPEDVAAEMLTQISDEIVFPPEEPEESPTAETTKDGAAEWFGTGWGKWSVYNFETRCIDFGNLHKLLFDENYMTSSNNSGDGTSSSPSPRPYPGTYEFHKKNWTETGQRQLTSAWVGIQLNDTMKYLEIRPPGSKRLRKKKDPAYQIRTRAVPEARKPMREFLEKIEGGGGTAAPPGHGRGASFGFAASGRHGAASEMPVISFRQRLEVMPPSSLAKAIGALASSPVLPEKKPTGTSSTVAEVATATRLSQPAASSSSSSSSAAPRLPMRGLAAAATTTATPRVIFPPFVQSPSYVTRIFPRDMSPFPTHLDHNRGEIWRDVPYANDVVFSVRRIQTPPDAIFQLREVQFIIPLGTEAQRKGVGGPNVLGGAGFAPIGQGGSRVRLTSNQRFVGVVDVGGKGVHIIVRLIPRSIRKVDSVRVNPELTFVLSGADNGWQTDPKNRPGRDEVVQIQVNEFYANIAAPHSTWIFVSKKTGWKEV